MDDVDTVVTTRSLLWEDIEHKGGELGYVVQHVCARYAAEQTERLGPRYGLDDVEPRVIFNDAFRLGYLLAQGRYTPDQLRD